MTQRDYARHVQRDPALVNRWYKAGRLVLHTDGSIDAGASDDAMRANMDPIRGGKRTPATKAAPRPAAKRPGATAPTEPADDAERQAAPMEHTTLAEAKAEDARYAAKLRRLEYEREVNTLVERARAEHAVSDIFGILGRSFDRVADKIGPIVAAETDPKRAANLLRAEFDKLLHEIANAVENLPATLVATRQ